MPRRPDIVGLPTGPAPLSTPPPSPFMPRVAGPLSEDQQVARQLMAAAEAVDMAGDRLDLDTIRIATMAYRRVLQLPEFEAQAFQRRKAREMAVEQLRDLGTSDRAFGEALLRALRAMAGSLCCRADHHEAAALERAKEVARVVLLVVTKEIAATS